MALETSGRDLLASLLSNHLSGGGWLGVGDSTTSFSAAHTDLQASTNKLRKTFDGGFPSLATNVITCQSTFATTEANFAWQEWGTFNAASAGSMVNRKVESLGTKTSAQSWTLTVTLTLTC